MNNFSSLKKNLVICLCSLFLLQKSKAIDDLPSGVPHVVDTNGDVLFVEPMFTTREFQSEGIRLVTEEANRVADELKLQELQPITKTNLVHAFIGPFGYTYLRKKLGNISTTNYTYGVEQDYKFSDLTVAKYDDRCRDYYEKYQWPISLLNTNAAYRLATQWLAAVHMDVKGLPACHSMAGRCSHGCRRVKSGLCCSCCP